MILSKEDKEYVNWMYHVPGIGSKKLKAILSHEIPPVKLYEMSVCGWTDYLFECCGFTKKQAITTSKSIEKWKEEKTPQQLACELYESGISFLLPQDAEYPEKLEVIPDAPVALYMKGNSDAALSLAQKSVAVIGARECSLYGRSVAQLLGKRCARWGLSVVSGMAYGVDGIAQSAALAEGGTVAAVLGSGVDVCYPYSNRGLYSELCLKGCVYSEYIPKTEPRPANFPPRNRIISGMADALIVVEAKEKSGTLITVDMALEQGKEVYVIPGRMNDPMSMGCNRLVRQGASIVCDVDEVLEEIAGGVQWGSGKSALRKNEKEVPGGDLRKRNPYPKESLRHQIYRALDVQPRSVQQIYESSVWKVGGVDRPTVEQLQIELFYMQMDGRVQESGGRFFVKL